MNRLGLFAKYWRPGAVKTRLAASLGDRIASEIYHGFLTTLLGRFHNVGDQRKLVYTPWEDRGAFEGLVDSTPWLLEPQSPGDLGNRLTHWFAAELATAEDGVVVIGSDSPNLPCGVVLEAFRRLQNHEFVIGPTEDGGYYLLGMRRFHGSLFTDIDWSTNQVFAQTMQRIASLPAPATCHVLRTWYDVDTLQDLRRLDADLKQVHVDADDELVKLRSLLSQHLDSSAGAGDIDMTC